MRSSPIDTGSRAVRCALLAFGVTLGAAPVRAQVLDPKQYESESGELVLRVEPDDMDGSGGATYRLSRNGDEVASLRADLALWDARVSDDGYVVGYAYEWGVHSGYDGASYNGLRIVHMAPFLQLPRLDLPEDHAADLRSESVPMSDCSGVQGLFLDVEHDRFVVRPTLGEEDRPEVWWSYRLSSGEPTGDYVPQYPEAQNGFVHSLWAGTLPGTELDLVLWRVWSQANGEVSQDGLLALLDSRGRQLWEYPLEGEFDAIAAGNMHWVSDYLESGVRQVEPFDHGFLLRSLRTDEELEFRVPLSPCGEGPCLPKLVERRPCSISAEFDPPEAPESEAAKLELLGTILLLPERPRPAISNVGRFEVTASGNLGFLAFDPGESAPRFVLVTPEGGVLTNVRLAIPEREGFVRLQAVPAAPGRWVAVRTGYREARTEAWWIDESNGALTELPDLPDIGFQQSLSPTGDGGFLIFSEHSLHYATQDAIRRFDAAGALLWENRQPGYGLGFDFDSVTWVQGLGVVGYDPGLDPRLQLFDPDGQQSSTVSLVHLGEFANEFSVSPIADHTKGITLVDGGSELVLRRLNRDGSLRSTVEPRYSDGERLTSAACVRLAPDGYFWASTGHSLVRFDEDGKVDRVLGTERDDPVLDRLDRVLVAPGGPIYGVNDRSRSIHVFDLTGAPWRTIGWPEEFLGGRGRPGPCFVDGFGDLVLVRSRGEETEYRALSPEGEWREPSWRPGESRGTLAFVPGLESHWVEGWKSVLLVDGAGRTVREIEKRPDGNWLQDLVSIAAKRDGAVAVLVTESGSLFDGEPALCLFDARGDPVLQYDLSPDWGFCDLGVLDDSVFLLNEGSLLLVPVDGGPARLAPLPEGDIETESWSVLPSPDGQEIWILDPDHDTIRRYRQPEA